MIESFEIQNFTAFKELDVSFSPRINVIIGSNGTGKTHLLKALYGLSIAGQMQSKDNLMKQDLEKALTEKFLRLFLPTEDGIGSLRTDGAKQRAQLCINKADDSRIAVSFNYNSKKLKFDKGSGPEKKEPRPVFIPTKEVLSLVRGMRHAKHDRPTVEMIFDDTYIDLVDQLVRPGFEDEDSSISEDPRLSSVIRELVDLVGGRYRWSDDGGFNFEAGGYQEKVDPERSRAKAALMYQDSTVTHFAPKGDSSLSSSMTAEGFRKIGVLHRLLCNGSINPGTTGVLLWDEPEANLNPRLMKELVQVLLELSRNGQQIILATHDYVLLKWFDLLMDRGKDDHVRFHVLVQEPDGRSVTIHTTDDYSRLETTGIAKTFSELYDAEINRSLEGVSL
jgi:predicted ATPase